MVALVLVLVSTLMGISAMQSSDVETQLSNNTRFHESAFRVAESASQSLLTYENIVQLVNEPDSSVISINSIEPAVVVSADFKALGSTPASGFSLGGQNGFQSRKFVATATADIFSVDSTSQVVQGVEQLTNSREK